MTPADARKTYERWLAQHENVGSLMRTLLRVEEHAIDEVRKARMTLDAEQAREVEARMAKSVAGYEEIAREAMRIRNMVEAEIFSAAKVPAARAAASCRAEEG